MIKLINRIFLFRRKQQRMADEVAYYKSLAAYYMEG